MRSDIVPVAKFPEYELPDHTAKGVSCPSYSGQHSMVLVLTAAPFVPRTGGSMEAFFNCITNWTWLLSIDYDQRWRAYAAAKYSHDLAVPHPRANLDSGTVKGRHL